MTKRIVSMFCILICATLLGTSGCTTSTSSDKSTGSDSQNNISADQPVSSDISESKTESVSTDSSATNESLDENAAFYGINGNIVYSSKLQLYDKKVYYTSYFDCVKFRGKIDLSYLGYVALPTFKDKQIDFFIIDNGYIYFTDEQSGTDREAYPATLYRSKIDGSELDVIAENVDEEFVLQEGVIKYGIYDSDLFKYYHTNNGKIENGSAEDWFRMFNSHDKVFNPSQKFGEKYAEKFEDGEFYIILNEQSNENLEFYRKDTKTGKTVLIGNGFSPQVNTKIDDSASSIPENITSSIPDNSENKSEEESSRSTVIVRPEKKNSSVQVSDNQSSQEEDDDAPRGYSAYATKLKELIKEYGKGTIYEKSNSNAKYRIKGLCYVNVLDFNNDGTDELLCVYGDEANDQQHMMVFGYDGSKVNTLFESDVFVFDDWSTRIAYFEENGQLLLLTRKNPQTYEIYEWSKLSGSRFEVVKSFSDFADQTPGKTKIDNTDVEREEFYNKLNEYKRKQTYVYLSSNWKVQLEDTLTFTDDMLELLDVSY